MTEGHPFTQAASQGYGEFTATIDDEEEQPDGPQSPEPEPEAEVEEEEEEVEDNGFTQTQERSYPTGIDSPDEEEEEEGPRSPSVDEEEEEEVASPSRRRVQIMNDSDNEDDDEEKEKNRHLLKELSMKKHKKRHSDEHERKSKRSRPDPVEEEATSDVEDVVDDIFGKDLQDADDQDEVAGELADLKNEEEANGPEETGTFDDEEDQGPRRGPEEYSTKKNDIMYEIDLFLEKKAEKRRGNRRRGGKNGDIDLAGPDIDRLVKKLIDQMKVATEEDRLFNKSRQPATAKLLLLPLVENQLCRADLAEIFIDNGILSVFKDWLSPLPDKSLPNIKIRESLIRSLQQFGVISADPLRDSGIGRALMFLYKHPRETKENKIKLIKIIHDWARPIFNLDTDYKHLTREEREQRDADQASSLKRQTSLTGKQKNRSADVDLPFASDRQGNEDEEGNDVDEECPRARVPRPSNKDYVVRPKSSVEYSEKKGDGKRKTISRLDEIKRRQQDRKRLSRPMPIVKLSIEGNRMHL